jgi:hypothetical protein
MKRILWRLTWGLVGLGLVFLTVESIEIYTASRRHEEFLRRTVPIYEGMTETEVRAVAGAPDKLVTDIGSTSDGSAPGAACRESNGSSAMLYAFEHCGWMCEHLGLPSGGRSTEVVCLSDRRRVVVNTYLELVHY